MTDASALEGRVRRTIFGDRYGLVLFLGVVCVATVYWRAGIFITDNETLVRTLGALADGRLWIEEATGGQVFDAPGAEVRDGRVYGRNYGQLVVSLPALWLLQAVDAVANLRVALTAGWHLLVLALVVQFAHVAGERLGDRTDELVVAGSTLVVGSFLLNLWLATPFPTPRLELLALQATTLVATAFLATVTYRLVADAATRRLGVLAGAASVLVLPVGFWATIPKRHVFSALVCLAILYAFSRSRDPDAAVAVPGLGQVPVYRASAYALVGFLTWIHAAEGLFVFLVLAAVDVPTAPSNDWRTLAFVGGVFALSLVPTVVTNWLVTGDPVRPPRTLGGGGLEGATAGDPAPDRTGGGTATPGPLDRFFQTIDVFPVSVLLFFVSNVSDIVVESVQSVTTGSTAYRIFLRSSGEAIPWGPVRFRGANLSVLESAPILGAFVGLGTGALVRLRPTGWDVSRHSARRLLGRLDPTATLAVGLALAFCAIYLSRLPVIVQVNVRYILPVYPLGLYLLCRSAHVRHLVTEYSRTLYWSFGGGVLVGGQVMFAAGAARNLAVAEAIQLHGRVGLACAGLLAVLVFASVFEERARRPAVVALGLAAASGTVLLLLASLHYFAFTSEYVLPVIQQVVDLLAPVR